MRSIPTPVLRSPEPVVRAFLRAYFDCDGYAGKQGVILSTASPTLASQTQLLLLNYGILSRKRPQRDGVFQVHLTGRSARRFRERIGFGLERENEALDAYIAARKQWKRERWDDVVVGLERGRGDVWDISVETTHRYAAAGFVNHNSYWHSKMMTEKVSDDSEIIEYAERNASVLETGSGGSTRTSSGSSSTGTSRSAGTAGSSARSGRTATRSRRGARGTGGRGSGARRSSRCASSTTT